MKILHYLILLLLFSLPISGCTISHTYGPYTGKVVDKETEEPIEGAVVFIEFYVDGFGGASAYVDAVETLTDQSGAFNIPAQRIYFVRPLYESWEEIPIIFKPGYGAYPRHKEVETDFSPYGQLPSDRMATVKLPKLKTREARKQNLRNISFTSNIPYEKWQHLFEYRNIENIQVGLTPYHIPAKKEK